MPEDIRTDDLDIDVLGPVRVVRNGREEDLRGQKPRLLLGILVASRDHAVSTESLIDRLWGDDPPATARKTVQVYVSNLRRALGDDGPLRTTPGGYVLQSGAAVLDVVRFEEAVELATTLSRTDPERARNVLEEALSLWRGAPYGGLEGEEALTAESVRLNELRLRAIELRIDTELRLGRHDSVLGELETLIVDHPYREKFRAQHMLALYRSGRQADALRSFAKARAILVDELGVEPSSMLTELELQILEQSPEIAPDVPPDSQVLGFLVTDIEDSTPKWELQPDEMGRALEMHDRILTEAVSGSDGRVFKHTGDGILAVFPDLAKAAAAAVTAQQALRAADWPTSEPIRVRAAVDAGPVQERAGDFYGPVLNRVMRIMSAGHGGQVLVYADVAGRAGQPTRPLGAADFKGIGRLEVCQITGGGLDDEHPELRTDRMPPAMPRKAFSQAVRGYELREELGGGNTGIVYRAYQASVGREVAVKVIRHEYANHPGFVKRFEAEAQFVAQLEHPHIVSLYDYWRDPDGAYLVMNYLRGGNLAQALQRSTFNPPAALRLLDHVGGALAYAHRHGVVHGDIKPANVLLDEDGNAYLGDFGIAHHHVEAVSGPVSTSVAYVSPEELSGGVKDARSDIYCLGLLAYETLTGHRPPLGQTPPPITDTRHDIRKEVGEVIARATSTDPEQRFQRIDDFLRALRQAFGADVLTTDTSSPTGGEVRNPFKGLRAFTEVDSHDFHGREALIDELVDMLKSRGFTAAVGPSGSGKSSVVKAGVLPAVRSGAIGQDVDWVVAEMFPGSFPFEELEACLLRVAVERPDGLLGELEADDRGLLRVSKQILPDDRTSLLLVIDQFEELFSLVTDPEVRLSFLDSLVTACRDERSRVKVLVTMRADFFDRPLVHPEFGELLKKGLVPVTMPSSENLAVAISRPARDAGLDIEPGLIPTIVGDVAGQPGGLPLLQYAMTELVDRRQGRLLTLDAYTQSGGALGALARRAEEIYEGLPESGKEAARELFLRLVHVDEEGEDTRRRIRRSELTSLALESAALDGVIDEYGSFRLLSFDHDPVTRGPTVEVAHEALIREWPRYREWVDERRGDLLNSRRLSALAHEWSDGDRDDGFLVHGSRFEQYREWATETDLLLTELEREYLQACARQAEEIAAREEENARRDESLRRRSRLLVGAAGATVVLLLLAAFAFVQRNNATAERERAVGLQAVAEEERARAEGLADRVEDQRRAQRLATEALAQLEVDPATTALLAIEAIRATEAHDAAELTAVDALHWGLQESGVVFPADESTPVAVRPGPSGLTGVFVLPVDQLVQLAQREVGRTFTDVECERFFPGETCPDPTVPLNGSPELAGGRAAFLQFTDPELPLRGTSVTIRGEGSSDADIRATESVFGLIADRYGITVDYAAGLELAFQAGLRGEFDLYMGVQPSATRVLAGQGRLIDLSSFISGAEIEDRFGAPVRSLVQPRGAGVDGPVYAVPMTLDNKSLVFFNQELFEQRGYEVPSNWEQLIALSDRMVADGITPWCWLGKSFFGVPEPGGFPVTDWIENLVIRESGPDVYDAWADGLIGFESAEVRRAFERLEVLVHTPGYSAPDPIDIPATAFFQYDEYLFGTDGPRCAMAQGANWTMAYFSSFNLNRLGVMAFPSIDPDYADAVIGGGNQVGALVDRPEHRALLRGMFDSAFAEAIVETDRFWIPANPEIEISSLEAGIYRDQIEFTHRAIEERLYRFDASDLMPPEIGLDAFFFETPAWFEDPGTLDTVLATIESARVEQLTGYRGDLLGISVSIDQVPGLVLLDFATYPGQFVLASNTRASDDARALSIRRISGWRTPAESTEISPRAPASIDPLDIDGWIAQNDIIELGRSSTVISGFPAEVRTVRVDPDSDLGDGVCPFDERPCFWPWSLSDAAEPPPETDEFNPFFLEAIRTFRIWVIDVADGDPINVIASAVDGDEAWLDDVAPQIENMVIEDSG